MKQLRDISETQSAFDVIANAVSSETAACRCGNCVKGDGMCYGHLLPDTAGEVERAARALCRLQWLDPEASSDPEIDALVDQQWGEWTNEAKAMIKALPESARDGWGANT